MFVINYADLDRVGYTRGSTLILHVDVCGAQPGQNRRTGAGDVPVNHDVLCVRLPICTAALGTLCRQISRAETRALRRGRVLVEVTAELTDGSEQQQQD